MSWVKLDDTLASHPKVDALLDADETLGLAALGLWTLILTYCAQQLTDGHVPRRVVRRLALENGDALAARLVDAGLLDAVEGGFQVSGYLDYNPSREKALTEREKGAARKRRSRERHRGSHEGSHDRSHGVTGTVTDAGSHVARPADPYPSRTRPQAGRPRGARDADPLAETVGMVVGVLQRAGRVSADGEAVIASAVEAHPDNHRAVTLAQKLALGDLGPTTGSLATRFAALLPLEAA